MTEKPKAEEFFYLDRGGKRQDASLHRAILNPVDFPIDEEVMRPIRAKHRADARVKRERKALMLKSARHRSVDEMDFMRECIELLTDEGADDPEYACQILWDDGDESIIFERDLRIRHTPGGHDHDQSTHGHRHEGGGEDDIAKSKTPASDLLAKNYPDDVPLDALKAQMSPEFKAAAAKAEAEMKDMQITSRRYQDANGKYVPERAELHRAIIRELFTPEAIAKATPKPGVKPVLILSGGRPAAGKTSSLKKELGNKLETSFYINADEIQEKLPGYKGAHAGIYNGEAQDIALQAEKVARHMGLNILYDATLKSKQPAQDRVLNYKDAGYDVDGYFVHTTPATSVHRSAARFMSDTGRYLPPEIPYNSRTNESTFDSLIPHLRNWALYDNNGAKPIRIAGNL